MIKNKKLINIIQGGYIYEKENWYIINGLSFNFSALFVVGCSKRRKRRKEQILHRKVIKRKIKIATLKGPTGMGMVKLMEENKEDYDISLFDAPDQIVSKVVSGEVDAAAVPSNLASVLYNKTKGQVQLVGVNTLGVLYIVENGDTIKI